MKRLLMLVGVAVVAAAMYVAASPASQQSKGVSVKQFNALKKTVAAQGKKVKALDQLAGLEVTLIESCVQAAVPIDQFGDGSATPTEGYQYSQPAGLGDFLTTALDLSDSSDSGALWITGGDSTCGTLVNGSGLRHAAARAGVQIPRTTHHWSFTPHQH